jgi:hypothetical protein
MKVFKVAWTDYKFKKKYIVGILIYDEKYIFRYNKSQIKEAIENGFVPFIEFPNIDEIYSSNELFQTFAIRLPNVNSKDTEPSLCDGAELSTDRIKIYCRTDVNEK